MSSLHPPLLESHTEILVGTELTVMNHVLQRYLHEPKSTNPLVVILIHTYKRGEVSNPLGVSLEAQA